jgi:hypothetical protein
MTARKPKPDPLVRRTDAGDLVALTDLVIERPNLGPGKLTHIRAGCQIPAEFAHLPRRAKP